MSEMNCTGIPVLVGFRGAPAQILERVPLTAKGKSEFDEAWLQRLIHDHPDCLPIAELEPGLDRFNAICREMPTPRGPLDNLLMTGRGDIALVETKLFRNPEARRQVLAQALDYATSLFEMSYNKFEELALSGNFTLPSKPATLYQALALPESEVLSEPAFIDAVTRNLRGGRALILIAGDGIREEAEGLLEGIQAHARFGFVVGLIELGVFRMPEQDDRFLVRPRTLAKTSIVRRTIVEVVENGAVRIRDKNLAAPETLGEDNYWQALEARIPGARAALDKLIKDVEPIGVVPDFLKSLILRYHRPGFKPISFGQISTSGAIWTDNSPPTYGKEVAEAFRCEAHGFGNSGALTPYKNGKPLQLSSVMDQLSVWIEPMRHLIAGLNKSDILDTPV